MVFVIETEEGVVQQVIPFMDSPGVLAYDLAQNVAKMICEQNGIEFEGDISCDGSVKEYSVQIVEQNE